MENINIIDNGSNILSKSKSNSTQFSLKSINSKSQNEITNSNNKLNKNNSYEKQKLNITLNNNKDDDESDEENDGGKNKAEEILFPETGTKDIYDNIHELKHQIQFFKKQLKIEEMFFEELLNLKTL